MTCVIRVYRFRLSSPVDFGPPVSCSPPHHFYYTSIDKRRRAKLSTPSFPVIWIRRTTHATWTWLRILTFNHNRKPISVYRRLSSWRTSVQQYNSMPTGRREIGVKNSVTRPDGRDFPSVRCSEVDVLFVSPAIGIAAAKQTRVQLLNFFTFRFFP